MRTDMVYFSIQGDRFTPFSLAKKLGVKAILESASFSKGRERYSLMMLDEAFRLIQEDEGVFIEKSGKKERFNCKGDILDALEKISGENDLSEFNIPIPSSGMGYLGYEFCQRCDTIKLSEQEEELGIPEAEFIVGHIYIVYDHFVEKLHVFGLNYDEDEADLEERIAVLKARLADLDFSYLAPPAKPKPYRFITNLEESKDEYAAKVKSLKENIVAGDLIQAVPSRRVHIESEEDALEIYRRLRSVSPSPYLFLLDFGSFQLVGASPESLVRMRDGRSTIRPIAGTRRRGASEAEDALLAEELLNDPKEKAEHLMLVDLARNDLGRVSEVGSVKVEKFMEVEKFSHVMHLVSDVCGKPFDKKGERTRLLRAAFPAGTVSGAPKIEAIERISALEKVKRRFYAGAVGYLDTRGGLDFCISIRCALKRGKYWTAQAGGGIVYDSNAEREFEETNEKLRAIMAVFGTDLNKENN